MLYHFSEDSSIKLFVPRENQNIPGSQPVVWAIDEENEYSYYVPRDCPRIVCRRTEETTEEHVQLFFNHTSAHTIVTVESGWYTKIAEQMLYRYHFHEDSFELMDKTAGYYVSHQTVIPLQVEPIDRLMDRLLEKGIELRFTPNLYPLRDAILASSFGDFGIYRFRNAKK
ncbi:hypothetical protein BK133_08475 [Paenibacillus sp. FSL H8-0548]|uniref:DUF6886 family protein n=1 Tax=Paenibacillus sp. FSL H8-0548 TaxID=1920422 RepID=UPI00096D018C|nr:DUF6886 family protein [Paenibacillus sp. FSL H8-0548]OMF36938.1 hypothetical protein BK133_08475 [Paenibacillus sp. FSL H8-0548]